MNDQIKKEITDIVCEIIEIKLEELNPDALFNEELGVDSLKALEILAIIENKYSITIDPERLGEMNSLTKVINIAMEYLENSNG